ncbi:hypothetical protein HON59_01355 [bacterium]|jgi:putative transposase|nr:hypothetical protein [bacterium]MBT3730111.1 hypothetical protein [bacterium]MBT4894696.1 hypothetical protein [bacterium]
MATRKFEFVNGDFCHIFNRGVDKRDIFLDKNDIDRFFKGMEEFNTVDSIGSIHENSFHSKNRKNKKLVNIICYCLNPNHYHFILEQLADNGITKFMHKIGGYSKYFNSKYKRSGALFQGKFKAVYLSPDDQLLRSSAYVNLNDKVHSLGCKAPKLSSWGEYVGDGNNSFCKKDVILDQFDNIKEYKKFAEGLLIDIKKQREEEKEIEKLLLE